MLLEEENEGNGRAFGDEMLVTRKMVVIVVMVKMKEIRVLIELDNQLLDHMSQTSKLQVN